jgi:hypothetical protein
VRLRSWSGLLSGTKNESVVFGQRQRVGGQLVQRGIAQLERRLHIAPLLLLAEDVGDLIGSKGARGVCFGDRGSHGLRAILANEDE